MRRQNDRERVNRAAEIQSLPARYITLGEPMDKKAAENAVRNFPSITMTNINDGRSVFFPIGTVGKILRHRGFNLSRIIKNIPELYKTSLLGWSEPEILKDGHKAHSNIKEYHHYVNKFTDGGSEYYVRFTICEMKGYFYDVGGNTIHSVAVSDITVYKKNGRSQHDRVIDPGEASPSPIEDRKPQEFFDQSSEISVTPGNIEDVTKSEGSQRIRLKVPGETSQTPTVDRKLQKFFGLSTE